MAELVLRLRDREIMRLPILNTRITLGRDLASDLVIDNAAVSRTHAILIYVDAQFRLRDNDSQNGITVNGKPVKDAVLNPGDVIGIGKFEIDLVESAEDLQPQLGSQLKGKAVANVVETVDVDAAGAASAREAIARAEAEQRAAKSRRPNPDPTIAVSNASYRADRPLEAGTRPESKRAAEPLVSNNDIVPILKIAGVGVAVLVAAVAATLFFLAR